MRIYWIRLLFVVFLIAIIARLFYWQIVKAEELQAQAEEQHFTDTRVTAQRGNIYYLDNHILASSIPSFNLYALPKLLTDDEKRETAYRMAKVLSDEESDTEEEAKNIWDKLLQDLYWVQLKKNIDLETKKKLEELQIEAIGFNSTSIRFYPEGSSSAHLLGFVGSDAKGGEVGYFGVEGYYDGELKGMEGILRHERDALGLPILTGDFLSTGARDGKDLVLNIDRSVQFIVEQSLKKGLVRYGAKTASAIVMDPETGVILALSSYPNYDPAKYTQFPPDYYKNPVVADHYEPGSTFKVLVLAAAINEEVVTPETKCDICQGPISLGGFLIRTWNNKYLDNPTMTDVIIHSDNTGMVYVGRKLGLDKFYQYLKDFGFGSSTNIDLQDEAFVDLRPKSEWREIDLATSSFGQGIAVTPIQMITAISAIANGGYLMEPQIVKTIKDNNQVVEIKPKIVRQILKESTAKIITEMMVRAVDEGESKWAKPKGFKIAGKTGTAQIPIAGHYDPEKTIASFVGFAPANDPTFVMLVRYDQPSSSIYGSETAAPTFFEIAKELFTYFKIAPSE
ncbi:MAG: penicillin-binding protein 2 [Candidatus Daviesbacteria bacterium]|nr:penicillin-binding protein 2 [Candidatus Daviesbacteria bacterium]